MSMGFRAESTNTSGVITVAGVDQVVINNAGNVTATTFTGALVGNAATATALSTATGTAPSYGVRAWVTFNGANNTSNVADASNTNRYIYGSGNITNVLRTGQGTYTIYFTTPMPDAFFSISGSARYASSGAGQTTIGFPNIGPSSWAADNISIRSLDYAGNNYDSIQINVMVIR